MGERQEIGGRRPGAALLTHVDADPHWRGYLFGPQRPGTRMEVMPWYWRLLLLVILVRRLVPEQWGLSTS